MKRKATLLTSLLLCLAVASCGATGIEIQLGELVEGTLTTEDEFTSWNSGSYYKTYNVDVDEGVQYRVSYWSDGSSCLCSQDDGELHGGDHDISLVYHSSDGPFSSVKAVFGSGGTWYLIPYVRSPNIDPGEVRRFRFKIERY